MSGEPIGGRFVLEAEVASGGSGTVFRARDAHTGRLVALKVLARRDPAAVAGFRREAALTERLSHPAVAGYVAQGVTPAGAPWLALDWVDGPTLRERLRDGPLTVAATLALGRGVADALARAHRAGVVHADVKPGNLLLAEGDPGRVHLTDFGVAAPMGQGSDLGAGTPAYMAPERLRAGAPVDGRADVFALGRVLAECLGGAPSVLDALLARMTAADPDARPADGDEVVAALDELLPPRRLHAERRLRSLVLAEGAPDAELARRAGAARLSVLEGAAYVLAGPDAARRASSLARRVRAVAVTSGRLSDAELLAAARRQPGVDALTARLADPRPGRPLVGRDLDLDVLEAKLEDCALGPGATAVLVDGRAGLGKTRLLDELVARAPGRTVLRASADPLDADQPLALLRQAAGEAWDDTLRAATARGPVLLVLDDLQWADRASVAALDVLLLELEAAPLLVVLGARPEVHDRFPSLWAGRGLRHLRLAPLSRRAAVELARGVLGPDADERAASRLAERGAGNPRFIAELAAAGDGPAPESVLALVEASFDELGGDARRVLRAASQVPGELSAEAIAALLGDQPAAVAAWLRELLRRELLVPRDDGCAFAHELVREAAAALRADR